jgi:hypothetical protein
MMFGVPQTSIAQNANARWLDLKNEDNEEQQSRSSYFCSSNIRLRSHLSFYIAFLPVVRPGFRAQAATRVVLQLQYSLISLSTLWIRD